MKKVVLLSLMLLIYFSTQAQSPATSKGASLVDGLLTFSSDGFNNDRGRSNFYSTTFGYQYFILDRFAVGLNGELSRFASEFLTTSNQSIGPEIAYYFDRGTPFIPYVSSRIRFGNTKFNDDDLKETNGALYGNVAAGMVFRQKHLAVLFELGYQATRINGEPQNTFVTDGNQIYFSVGIAGFIFKDN